MQRACVINFKGSWKKQLPLVEFSHNCNYQATVNMAPYKALYRRKCKILVH